MANPFKPNNTPNINQPFFRDGRMHKSGALNAQGDFCLCGQVCVSQQICGQSHNNNHNNNNNNNNTSSCDQLSPLSTPHTASAVSFAKICDIQSDPSCQGQGEKQGELEGGRNWLHSTKLSFWFKLIKAKYWACILNSISRKKHDGYSFSLLLILLYCEGVMMWKVSHSDLWFRWMESSPRLTQTLMLMTPREREVTGGAQPCLRLTPTLKRWGFIIFFCWRLYLLR